MFMKNEIFNFANEEFGTIRTVTIDNKPYFVASDIAKSLGYKRPNDAVSAHCRYTVKHSIPHPQSKSKTLSVNIIPEGDVYRLITHSELPSAEKFETWVFDEVLPSIRKHGMYATESTIEEMLGNPDTMIRVLTELKNEQQKNKELKEKNGKLEKENAELIPDANMARDIIHHSGLYSLKEVSDLLDSGRTKFCTLLRMNKVLSKQTGYNLPLNKYLKQGYFKVKINQNSNTPVTFITPKGLQFIYRLIKKYDMFEEFNTEALLNEIAKNKEVAA